LKIYYGLTAFKSLEAEISENQFDLTLLLMKKTYMIFRALLKK